MSALAALKQARTAFLSTLTTPEHARPAILIAPTAPKQARSAFSSALAAPGQARASILSAPAALKQARTALSSALAALEQAGAGHFERQVAPPSQAKPSQPARPSNFKHSLGNYYLYKCSRSGPQGLARASGTFPAFAVTAQKHAKTRANAALGPLGAQNGLLRPARVPPVRSKGLFEPASQPRWCAQDGHSGLPRSRQCARKG